MTKWLLISGLLLWTACRHQSSIDEPIDSYDRFRLESQIIECHAIYTHQHKDQHGHWQRCQTLIAPASIEATLPRIEAEASKFNQLPDYAPNDCPYVINALLFGERASWWPDARNRVSRLCCERKTPHPKCSELPK